MLVLGLQAQNGNAVVSQVEFYDLGNGQAALEVRISGNLASPYATGTFTAQRSDGSGAAVTGGLITDERPVLGGPSTVVMMGAFPFSPSISNGGDFYDFEINVAGIQGAIIIGNKTKKEANNKHYSR